MMEVIMAIAKTIPEPHLINEIKKGIQRYEADKSPANRTHLSLFCMMFALKEGTQKLSTDESIKIVTEARKAMDFFNPPKN